MKNFGVWCLACVLAVVTGEIRRVRVAQGNDDVSFENGGLDFKNNPLRLGQTDIGVMFRNVNIPADAVIESAFINFTVRFPNEFPDPIVSIYAETGQVFPSPLDGSVVSGQKFTSWTIPAEENFALTPDIKDILGLVLKQSDYAPENPLFFIFLKRENDVENFRAMKSFNDEPEEAPELVVEFNVETRAPTSAPTMVPSSSPTLSTGSPTNFDGSPTSSPVDTREPSNSPVTNPPTPFVSRDTSQPSASPKPEQPSENEDDESFTMLVSIASAGGLFVLAAVLVVRWRSKTSNDPPGDLFGLEKPRKSDFEGSSKSNARASPSDEELSSKIALANSVPPRPQSRPSKVQVALSGPHMALYHKELEKGRQKKLNEPSRKSSGLKGLPTLSRMSKRSFGDNDLEPSNQGSSTFHGQNRRKGSSRHHKHRPRKSDISTISNLSVASTLSTKTGYEKDDLMKLLSKDPPQL